MAPELSLDESQNKRPQVYSRREKCIALFVGALLISYGYGTDMASGVLYAKLLEKRSCTAVESLESMSIVSNASSQKNRSHVTISQENEKNKTSECGGLGEGVSATVWVASIYTAMRCFFSPLGGIALDTFGSRGAAKLSAMVFMIGTTGSLLATRIFHLYFTTVITGIGGALSSIVGFQILNSVYPDKKVVVAGFGGFCVGILVVIIAFVGTYSMEEAGWRGYYYLIDGILTVAVLASVFLPTNMYVTAKMDKELAKKKSKCEQVVARFHFSTREFARGFRRAFGLYRDPGFHLLNIGYMLYSVGNYFPFLFVVKQAKDFGASEAKANRQVVYVGPALGLGAVVFCFLFYRLKLRALVSQGVSLIGMAFAIMSMTYVRNYDELLILAVILSFISGPAVSLASAASDQAVRKKQLAYHCLGHTCLWSTIPILVGPPFAAFLHDVSGTYTVPYITGGVCVFIGGLLLCLNDRRAQRLVKAAEKKMSVCVGTSHDDSPKPTTTVLLQTRPFEIITSC